MKNKNTIIFGDLDINGTDIEKFIPKEYFKVTKIFDTNFQNLRTAISENKARYVLVNAYNLNEKDIIDIVMDMMDFNPNLCKERGNKFLLFFIVNKNINIDNLWKNIDCNSCVLFQIRDERDLKHFGKMILEYNDNAPQNEASLILFNVFMAIAVGIAFFLIIVAIGLIGEGISFLINACIKLFM